MGGLLIINSKPINGLMGIYGERFLHLRALAGGQVRLWLTTDVHDTQYSLTKIYRTLLCEYRHYLAQQHLHNQRILSGRRTFAPCLQSKLSALIYCCASVPRTITAYL